MAKVILVGSLAESLLNFRGDFIAALQKQGHDVIAVAPRSEGDIEARLKARGITYLPIPLARTGMNPIADSRTFIALWQLYRAQKADVVIAYTIKPVIYGLLAAQLAGIKRRYAMITGLGYAFTLEGGGMASKLVGLLAKTLYTLALRGAPAVTFQNPDDRAVFLNKNILSKKTPTAIVGGSGVNLSHFAPTPLPEKPIFLLIARLLFDKGVREYAAACAEVKRKHPDAECHLVGPLDGNPTAITMSEVEAWVKADTLTYHGALADVRPAIAAASVYVLPSYREGTPRSVLEAMAMGRAVITTDAPGCRETVVDGKNGFLVPVKDSAALAEAMLKLAADNTLRESMGAQSLALVRQKYDVNAVNQALLEIMQLAPQAKPVGNNQAA